MLLLGHVGITLGAVEVISIISKRIGKGTSRVETSASSTSTGDVKVTKDLSAVSPYWLNILANPKNLLFLIIGSLLPDIIDKPVGLKLIWDTFGNGRIFCHTLLFLVIVATISFFLYRRYGKTSGIALSLGILTHLILDQMWLTPATLFWPLFGLHFERFTTDNWLGGIFYILLNDPAVYVPEIIGALIITYLLLRRHIFSKRYLT